MNLVKDVFHEVFTEQQEKSKVVSMKWRILSLLLISFLFVGCLPPLTKGSYLRQYESFIAKVKEDAYDSNFSWEKADEKFELFSKIYYQRFEQELNNEEKNRCRKYWLEYQFIKLKTQAGILKDDLNGELKKVQDRIQNYIEDDMPDDFEKLKREAQKAIEKIKRKF
jgi:hypothetical protein